MYSYCITLVLVGLLSSTLAANCFGPASKLAVTEFDAFPSTVPVGGTVYIRANINPTYDMGQAQVNLTVYYTDEPDVRGLTPVIMIDALFCNLSTSITCPLTAGSRILYKVTAWEFRVPDVLPGTYQIKYTIIEDNPKDGNAYSCIQFAITVEGQKADSFVSSYQATLLGTALFSNQNYKDRHIGESLQVGPSGPLNSSISPVPDYGNIKFLSGSGDLVPNAYYDTSNFVWGLSGVMTGESGRQGQISHVYRGECYLGYINNADPTALGNKFDYVTPLLAGTFELNWTYTDSATAKISGSAMFHPAATIPYGWGFPLLFGRLGTHEILTSDVGFLMIRGSLPFCATGLCATPPSQGKPGGHGLSSSRLGIAIGVPLGLVFLAVLIAGAIIYARRRRDTEQEDGIFAASRKPEYGSALVVDGIIEETMGNKTLQTMVDMRDADDGSDLESDDDGDYERGRSRTRSRSRSVNRSRSASSAGSESERGASASRDSDSD